MEKVVIYARYSSHAQKDASIEQQLLACRKFAREQDFQIIAEYCDHALTGTTDKRPEFLRMVKDSGKRHFTRVLVYKIDRFARNRYDSAMYKTRLKKNGVKVMSVMEPIPEGPEGILLEAVLEGSAEYYSANLSQNVKRGMEDNARACKVNNGTLPLGYVKGSDGRFQLDPAGAAIVREIFELYAGGWNTSKIITHLNARALRTSHGAKWNKNSLNTILRNERYTGVYIWGDIRVEGGVPAIIPLDLFHEVQARIKRVAKAPAAARTDISFLLTGKLFCGHCGSTMIGESGTGKSGTRYYYYTCSCRKREGACSKKPVKKEWIEDLVIRKTRDICLTDSMIDKIADAAIALQQRERDDSILISLQKELSQTERGIKNIIDAIQAGIITAGTKERLEVLESRRTELLLAIEEAQIEQPQLTKEQLVYWLEQFRAGDPADPKVREAFINIFISAIYLYDDKIKIVCNYTADGSAVSYDFVDRVEEEYSERALFVLNPSSSTRKKHLLRQVLFSTMCSLAGTIGTLRA